MNSITKKIYNQKYYQLHKAEITAYNKKYQQIHKIEHAVHTKAYYQTHKIEAAEYDKKYRFIHKDKFAARLEARRKTIVGYLKKKYYEMRSRCNNPKNSNYKKYGKQGIKVEFKSSNEFVNYVINVLKINTYEKIKELQIHRIDNNGHYAKNNIEFLTSAEHQIKHKNRKVFVRQDWCDIYRSG